MDLVEIKTIALALKRDRECAEAWLSSTELVQLDSRARAPKVLAARVAAKEAVAKSLGTGFAGDVAWHDIEIINDRLGCPKVVLSCGAKAVAESLGVVRVLVSITHTETTAGACAIAIGGESTPP